MSDKRFFDTNVLVYACDSTDLGKQAISLQLIAEAAAMGSGVLSVQVLGEFFHAVVVRRRLLTASEAEGIIRAYRPVFPVVNVDFDLVCAAIRIHRRFQLRYWDSLIVAAARLGGCTQILSEDLNHGQDYDGVTVSNPFRGGVAGTP
jgi:predicted nucleic acid-binding protein